MSAEPRRTTKTEVWVGWENQVVNGIYPLRRFLGGSNHSAVFLTEYRPEGIANAAIKLLPADALETEAQLVQWGTAATLRHPHLMRLFDVGRAHIGGRVFLFVVMEYADQTLAQLLPRRALSPDETRDMLIPALSALTFLHRNSLVQGQMKPTNFLVVGDQLKLASDTIRSTGNLSGGMLRASFYDPPELKDGEIAPAGDIWGLGVTLVEALTQHPPTWPDAKSETVSLTASIPPLFIDTVRRCLNRTPANRPTAGELEGQFNPAVHAHPITVVAAEEPVYEVATVSTASNEELSTGSPRAGAGGSALFLGVAAVLVLGLAVWVSRTIFVARFEMGGSGPGPGAAIAVQQVRQVAAQPGVGQQMSGDSHAQKGSSAPTVVSRDDGATGYVATGNAADRDGSVAADAAGDGGALSGAADAARTASHEAAGADPAGVGSPPHGVGEGDRAGVESARYGTAGADTGQSRSVWDRARDAAAASSGASAVEASATAPAHPVSTARAAAAAPTATATSPAGSATALGADSSPQILGSVLHQNLPDVPRPIREKIRGHVNVTVRVLVDPTGNVVGQFLENAGPSRYFARQAGDAATEWKFVPTDAHGPRVWMLRFEFTRAGVTVNTVGTQ